MIGSLWKIYRNHTNPSPKVFEKFWKYFRKCSKVLEYETLCILQKETIRRGPEIKCCEVHYYQVITIVLEQFGIKKNSALFWNHRKSSAIFGRVWVRVFIRSVPKYSGDIRWSVERFTWCLEGLGNRPINLGYLRKVSGEFRPPSKDLGLPLVVMRVLILTSDIFVSICTSVSNLH